MGKLTQSGIWITGVFCAFVSVGTTLVHMNADPILATIGGAQITISTIFLYESTIAFDTNILGTWITINTWFRINNASTIVLVALTVKTRVFGNITNIGRRLTLSSRFVASVYSTIITIVASNRIGCAASFIRLATLNSTEVTVVWTLHDRSNTGIRSGIAVFISTRIRIIANNGNVRTFVVNT
jgi:hypothetical protein